MQISSASSSTERGGVCVGGRGWMLVDGRNSNSTITTHHHHPTSPPTQLPSTLNVADVLLFATQGKPSQDRAVRPSVAKPCGPRRAGKRPHPCFPSWCYLIVFGKISSLVDQAFAFSHQVHVFSFHTGSTDRNMAALGGSLHSEGTWRANVCV